MLIGHIAVGLAAKRAAPKTSLGTLLLAVEWPDLLWPLLLLLGVERVKIIPGYTRVSPLDFVSYPISHSLLADLGWAFLLAGLYALLKKNSVGAAWIFAGVMSHWVLDALSHRPDLPLYPGSSTLVGLGLWNSLGGTLVLELGMFFGALALYLKGTRARDQAGVWLLWSLVVLLMVLYFGALFGPPPPSPAALAEAGLFMWVLIPWGNWIDRHREARGKIPAGIPAGGRPREESSRGV
jgi:membrane-bound metal-dependent hydrolase YbcI (DUF457 family)